MILTSRSPQHLLNIALLLRGPSMFHWSTQCFQLQSSPPPQSNHVLPSHPTLFDSTYTSLLTLTSNFFFYLIFRQSSRHHLFLPHLLLHLHIPFDLTYYWTSHSVISYQYLHSHQKVYIIFGISSSVPQSTGHIQLHDNHLADLHRILLCFT